MKRRTFQIRLRKERKDLGMRKTRLGISVGLLGAALFFVAQFSGYLGVILIGGYILLFEENAWLKKSAVKAMAVLLLFSFAIAVLGLIPDCFDVIDSILGIFKGSFNIAFISRIISCLTTILRFVEKLLFLGLGLKAFNQGTIPVPFVDSLVEKGMSDEE